MGVGGWGGGRGEGWSHVQNLYHDYFEIISHISGMSTTVIDKVQPPFYSTYIYIV